MARGSGEIKFSYALGSGRKHSKSHPFEGVLPNMELTPLLAGPGFNRCV